MFRIIHGNEWYAHIVSTRRGRRKFYVVGLTEHYDFLNHRFFNRDSRLKTFVFGLAGDYFNTLEKSTTYEVTKKRFLD
jgi:hypothetical protein